MLTLIPLIAAALVAAAPAPSASPAPRAATSIVAPRDSADTLWRRAREAYSNGDFARAAELFAIVRTAYPTSKYAADSYYWEAFSLSRDGGRTRLRKALDLLTTQQENFASATSVKSGESRTLSTRIRGQLARGGDADAAAAVVAGARVASAFPGAAATTAATRTELDAARISLGVVQSAMGGSGNAPPGCKDEDDDERVEALNALLQMNGEQALPILKKVLQRRDQCSELLRRKAVFLVSQKRTDETADILLNVAKSDPDAETREQAVFWLSQVSGEKAEQFLLGILKDSKDEELQKKALFSLSQRQSDKSQQALRGYASRADAPFELRSEAIFWIGQRRTEENAKYLRELFGKVNQGDVQEKILFSLSQMKGMGNDTFILEQSANAKLPIDLRKQALFFAAQGTAVTSAQLAGIYDKSVEADMREQVIFALSQRGNRDPLAVDKLLDIAKTDKDRELRKKAIFWLGQSKDPRAAKLLQELIER